ncbi:MAG: L-histidine N(alpha)-methyltransferase [Bacteroidetes bacterium]|nr:L-histidine N(alpha)-methyltransferase [Bacteroidota bacterium]
MREDVKFQVEEKIINEILAGLKSTLKNLPCKLFYDEKGSQLFDQICELDEYYPTRTELKIMEDNINEIISPLNADTLLVEFGSGSSHKTQLILDNARQLGGYVPIDISEIHLMNSVERLRDKFPRLNIYPLVTDYTQPIVLPKETNSYQHRIAYFPGSTIGNFTNTEAKEFFKIIAEDIGTSGGFLIGADLQKDRNVIESAYNDESGVTALFNLNILEHINKYYGGEFDLSKFEHFAPYNEEKGRIEMYLRSREDQHVTFMNEEVIFKAGELLLTEYSYKYTLDGIAALAGDFFDLSKVWIDDRNYFSLQYLTAREK